MHLVKEHFTFLHFLLGHVLIVLVVHLLLLRFFFLLGLFLPLFLFDGLHMTTVLVAESPSFVLGFNLFLEDRVQAINATSGALVSRPESTRTSSLRHDLNSSGMRWHLD